MTVLKAARTSPSFICRSCRQRLLPSYQRQFSITTPFRAEDQNSNTRDDGLSGLGSLGSTLNRTSNMKRNFNRNQNQKLQGDAPFTSILDGPADDPNSLYTSEAARNLDAAQKQGPHRLHVYSHKHNTHLTFVQPTRSAAETASSRVAGARVTSEQKSKMVDTLLSLSTGNLGFRKAGRGSYDAAFQLTAFALKQIQEKGMLREVQSLEVILRGFGAGREAVTKALLGTEGRLIRGRITSVVDATRLKQGGPRSRKPRRLG